MSGFLKKLEIVEVTAQFIKKGQTHLYQNLEPLLFEKDFGDTIRYIKTDKLSANADNIYSTDNIIFTEDNIALDFRWVGIGNSINTSCDIYYSKYGHDIFNDDKVLLIDMAKKNREGDNEYVKFLVKYEFSFREDHEDEYEKIKCLGGVDVKNL